MPYNMGRVVLKYGASCLTLLDKLSWSKFKLGQFDFGRVVFDPSCP